MVDREARDRMAELLRHLASGQITVGEYRASVPSQSSDRGVRATASCSFDDYTELCVECMEASLADGFRYNGPYALPSKERRTIAQCILFLQGDEEYGYRVRESISDLMHLLLRGLPPSILLKFLLVGLMRLHWTPIYHVAHVAGKVALAWMALSASCAMLGVLVIFFHGLLAEEDISAWPFQNRPSLETALKHPKLLCGRRA